MNSLTDHQLHILNAIFAYNVDQVTAFANRQPEEIEFVINKIMIEAIVRPTQLRVSELFQRKMKIPSTPAQKQNEKKVWELINLPPYLKKKDSPLVYTEQYIIKNQTEINTFYESIVSNDAEKILERPLRSQYVHNGANQIEMYRLDYAMCLASHQHLKRIACGYLEHCPVFGKAALRRLLLSQSVSSSESQALNLCCLGASPYTYITYVVDSC